MYTNDKFSYIMNKVCSGISPGAGEGGRAMKKLKNAGVIKKVMSMLLVFTLLVTYMPDALGTSAYAAAGPNDGQVEYAGGSKKATGSYDIEVSKTIQAVTGMENYFDITLKTTTHRHKVNMSTDVVIVLDISNTMNTDKDGNENVSNNKKKITFAKNATNAFIQAFATNNNLDEDRNIAVVTFNRDAQTVVEMTQANDLSDYNRIKKKIDAITAPTGDAVKWTNIEGGLKLASNILQSSEAKYKYVILLTDGFPTTYLTSSASSSSSKTKLAGYNPIMGGSYSDYDSSKINKEGYFANTRAKYLCYQGTSYSDRAAKKAQATATDMHKAGINVFSVGIALKSQNINSFWAPIIDTTGMKASDSYVIGTTEATYKNWLENKIAGGTLLSKSKNKYADAYNETEMKKDFNQILSDIEHAPETTMRQFYTLDPMSDEADFIGFYDKNGKLAATPNKLTGESKLNAENTAVYGGSGNADRINWNMLESGFKMDGEEFVYTLKYRVRLKNESSGFKWSSAYKMNDTTTLNYSQKYVESGADVPDGTGTLEYPIPETEGYKGSLKFKKIDGDTGKALSGVEFTLQHYAESCSVCSGDASIKDVKAVSGTDGYVSFDNIPSGHEYLLIENEPDGYAPVHNHTVIVSYGETYIGTKTAANKLTNGVFEGQNNSVFTITNTKVEPVEIQFQTSKTFDGKTPAAGTFEFLLKGTDTHDTDHHELVKNAADGTVTFKPIIYDTPGTYEYTISEVVGKNAGIIYDSRVHTVKVVVSENAGKTAYKAAVTIDSGTPVTYVGTDNVIETVIAGSFSNTSRPGAKVELKAEKAYPNLRAGDFRFKLEAVTKDAPLPADTTVENRADGSISFGEITYTAPGTYIYKISEEAGTNNSIVYDTAVYQAVVTVTAPADLTDSRALHANVEYQNADGTAVALPSFVNKDRLIPEITMKGYKSFNGKDAADGTFAFVFQQVDDQGTLFGTPHKLTNGQNGIIDFDDILEDEVRDMIAEVNERTDITSLVRNYKIFEEAGTDDTVKYDNVYYVLHVGVYAQNSSDYYLLNAIMQKVDGTEVDTLLWTESVSEIDVADADGSPLVKFENTSSVSLNLQAKKSLDPNNQVNKTLKAGEYTFILEGPSGKLQEKTNDKDGNVKFDAIEFTAGDVGTHSYVIYEKEGSNMGMFYDDSLYTVTVEVALDAAGNLTMTAPVITDEYDAAATEMEFVNKDIEPTHLHLKAAKTVNGQMPTVAQTFEFQLIDVTDADHPQVIETMKNVHSEIAFTGINLDKKGIYKYIIKEVLPADEDNQKDGIQKDGFTYDETEYDVTVEVTDKDNDGILEKLVMVNGNYAAAEHNTVNVGTFNNVYETKSTAVAFRGNKELTGKELMDGMFSFAIAAVTNDAPLPADLTDTTPLVVENIKVDSQNGTFAFGEITFTKAGVYEYTVREVIPQDAVDNQKNGMTYDDTVYTVRVTVTDDGAGQLIAEYTVDGSKTRTMDFVNKYRPAPTAIRITADKTLTGRTLQNGEFEFRLVEVDAADQEIPGTAQTVTNGTSSGQYLNKVYFDSISFDEEGTHTYKITEVEPDAASKLGGVTYSKEVFTVTVTVVDENGELKVKDANDDVVTTIHAGEFKNTYAAGETKAEIKAFKTMTGKTVEADEFTFVLTAGDENTPMPGGTADRTVTVTNAEGGSITFGEIPYAKTGVYTYTIHEVQGTDMDTTYDDTVFDVTVTVTDEGTGILKAEVASRNGAEPVALPTFENIYETQDAHLVLKAMKRLSGKALNTGDFSFILTDVTDPDPQNHKVLETVSNGDGGAVTFSTLIYGKDDVGNTYKYTITEANGGQTINGVTYDQNVLNITVEVFDDGSGHYKTKVNGVMAAEYSAGTFLNTYAVSGTSIKFTANKSLIDKTNHDAEMSLADGQFTFHLVDGDGKVLQNNAVNAADGTIEFIEIPFSAAGEYVFMIHEAGRGTNKDGIDYSDQEFVITVDVRDNGDGTLTPYVDGNAYSAQNPYPAGTFVNEFNPDLTHLVLHGVKSIDGKSLQGNDFTFNLVQVDNQGTAILNGHTDSVKNAVDGSITFAAIEFDEFDDGETYYYKITEEIGTDGGIEYNPAGAEYLVEVSIAYNSSDELVAAVTVNGAPYDPALKQIAFHNRYDAANITVALAATKTVSGAYNMEADQFEFVLAAEGAASPMPGGTADRSITVTNAADGSICFAPITYTLADVGTHTYTLSETAGTLGGITYTTAVHSVTVVIEDNGDGTLSASVNNVPYAGPDAVNVADFVNSYHAGSTYAAIGATKVLQGKTLEADAFEFTLTDVTDPDNPKMVDTAKNLADGSIVFDSITYLDGEEGTYIYEVSEVNGGQTINYMKYDSAVLTVTVEVVDNQDGTMSALVDGVPVSGVVNAGTFTNLYEEPVIPEQVVTVSLEASKTLEGRALTAGEFQFQLKDSTGKVIQTKTNAADGSVKFGGLYYPESKAGTYHYTVSEVAGDGARVFYDETVYNVTVIVKYGPTGKLIADVLVDGAADKPMTFHNVYDPVDAVLKLNAEKTYFDADGNAQKLQGGEFTFQLKDAAGSVIADASNGADGSIRFDALTLGAAGTYTYTISEVTGGNAAVTYWDGTVYTAVVTVAETEPGVLSVTSVKLYDGEAEAEAMTFFNEGKPIEEIPEEPGTPGGPDDEFVDLDDDTPHAGADPDNPKTSDESNVMMWLLVFAVSGMGAAGSWALRRKIK